MNFDYKQLILNVKKHILVPFNKNATVIEIGENWLKIVQRSIISKQEKISKIIVKNIRAFSDEAISNLIIMYRNLPKKKREKLTSKAYKDLKSQLKKTKGQNTNSYNHYLSKVKQLIENLGYAAGLKYHDSVTEANKYIELKDIKKLEEYLTE